MPPRRCLPALLLAVAVVSLAPHALAEATPEAKAAADALYVQAGKLGDEQKWPEAMAKLEASLALDPAIGTLNRLAYAAEKLGLLATAWSRYHDMEALARRTNDKRAADAAANATRLEPLLANLVIEVAAASRAGDLEVRKDGTPIKPGAFGVPVPVDPGLHVVEASRPGKQGWKTTVTIEPKPGVTTVQVPALKDEPAPSAAAPEATPRPAAPPPFWGSQRIAGATVAGVGVIGAAIGAALGVAALNKASNLKSTGQCNADLTLCTAAGMPDWQSAQAVAHGSTAALVIGGATLVTGVVLFAMGGAQGDAPVRSARGWVSVGAGVGGVVVKGGW